MKFLHLSLLILSFQCVFAQNNSSSYYNQFDQLVGSFQNDLNTGELFEDLYRTKSKTDFRFFKTYDPIDGKVNYKGQEFYKCALKYDLYEDNLLLVNFDATNPYLINLEKTLVQSFSLQEKEFVKLPAEASNFSFYKNGFFERISHDKEFSLYVKHIKLKSEELGASIYYSYSKREIIVLEYKLDFYEITSRNSIIKILPERKQAIKLFYKNYDKLYSQNKIDFMKKLFTSLTTTTP